MTDRVSGRATRASLRSAGSAAILSGAIGLIAFGSLVAYLTNQEATFEETGVIPAMGRVLLTLNYLGVMLQALLMIPVALAIRAFARDRSPGLSRAATLVGVCALAVVALLRLLLFLNPRTISDILFMGPMGFVGAWLIMVNRRLPELLSKGLRMTGTVAGVGWIIASLSFFLLGGLAVLTEGPFAYTTNVPFHIGLAIGGFPASILYPIWAILLGRRLVKIEGPDQV